MFRNHSSPSPTKADDVSHLSEFNVVQDADATEDDDGDDEDLRKAKFTFRCALCPSTSFSSVYQLIAHKRESCPTSSLAVVARGKSDASKDYTCFVCRATFPWIGSLARHVCLDGQL